jgi:2'-5' RNA ligase
MRHEASHFSVGRYVLPAQAEEALMRANMTCVAVFVFGLAALFGSADMSIAQQNPVIAIDVALRPDATMVQRARAANARLLKAYPAGFALDATHNPHITMLQQFVRTADLDKVFAAVSEALAGESPTTWTLTAFKYYALPMAGVGVAGIVIEPTDELIRLQQKIIDAVLPYSAKTGTVAAFMSTDDGRDIQSDLIDYVKSFISIGSGKKFNPHVTIGVASDAYLKTMLAEPFESFTFQPAGASVYQLGTFGTARKELKSLPLRP